MFLRIEGEQLINLARVSRVELYHHEHQQFARLFNAGVLEAESHLAYQYFTNPANAELLFVREAPELPKEEEKG